MDILQKRMEELQRQYMKEKETLRFELYSTLLTARKMAQEQELASHNEISESEFGLSPQLAQLQQEKQRIQNQIDEHIRQQQQVKQQQLRFNQLQANTERDIQQQRLLQQQLQHQLQHQMTVFSPPPHQSSKLGGPALQNTISSSSSSPFQPVPSRYPASGQVVTVNGLQAMQMVNLPAHQQQPHHHLVPPVVPPVVQPQHFFSVGAQPDQLAMPRPQSFGPARFSPRAPDQDQPDQETGDSLKMMENQHKRDSFSDSGQDSGTNTPTRGRTITEGLLRFVQDSSVSRPTLRQTSMDIGSLAMMAPSLRTSVAPQALVETPQHQLVSQTSVIQPKGAVGSQMLPLSSQQQQQQQQQQQAQSANYILQLQQQQQPSPGYVAITTISGTGRESVPVAGRDSAPLVGAGRESVPVPLLAGRHTPLSVPLTGPLTGPGQCVLQTHGYPGLPPHQSYMPAGPSYPAQYRYLAHQPQVQVQPGYYQPGLASSGEVNIMRQPIMSSVAQPSNYLAQPPQYRTVQTVPVMVQYQPVPLPQYQQPCLAPDTDIQVDGKYLTFMQSLNVLFQEPAMDELVIKSKNFPK